MSRIYLVCLFCLVVLFFPRNIYAGSPYVLPYPSAMPGSIIYKLNIVQEEILKYWYFGDLGQFKYNLQQSDKYLVEAKTLFDYRQYLLAHKALQKSDKYFQKVKPAISSAKKTGKDINSKEQMLKEAAEKHIEELSRLKENLPVSFEWKPEKQKSMTLELWKAFELSIKIRQVVL